MRQEETADSGQVERQVVLHFHKMLDVMAKLPQRSVDKWLNSLQES
jgi:hypothetical protein